MAKRYVFRLEAVLKLRKRREDDWRRRVAEQSRKVAAAQGELRLIEDELRGELSRTREGQLTASLDVTFASRQRGYLSWLERRKLDAGQHLATLDAQLRQQQGALIQASREVKTLEKLRERQQARAAECEHRALRVEEDEIGRQAFMTGRAALAERAG